MLEFAQEINRADQLAPHIVLGPLPADDPKKRKPDITMARELLGWGPRYRSTKDSPARSATSRTSTAEQRAASQAPGS